MQQPASRKISRNHRGSAPGSDCDISLPNRPLPVLKCGIVLRMDIAPSLFISHGAPTFALDPGVLGPRLAAIGANLSGVNAIAVISPHWQTSHVSVMSGTNPATLHDFAGFPKALYELQYPAPGHPDLAQAAAALIAEAGFSVSLDAQRGFDHGAWVPLRYLRPNADIPVFQISMPRWLNAAEAFKLGRALTPLRARGVLLIGSGSLTHNLGDLRPPHSEDAEYAQMFADWVRDILIANDSAQLLDYRQRAPQAERAHPSDEHFLPLLVAYATRIEGEVTHVIHGGMTYGTLSMDSYGWGLPPARVLRR